MTSPIPHITDELKPCPFCKWSKCAVKFELGAWLVECPDCFALGPTAEDEQSAADEWNRRAGEDARDAARYRYWRTHRYKGLLDIDNYCDPNSPQAIHFDRLTDAAMAAGTAPERVIATPGQLIERLHIAVRVLKANKFYGPAVDVAESIALISRLAVNDARYLARRHAYVVRRRYNGRAADYDQINIGYYDEESDKLIADCACGSKAIAAEREGEKT